MSPAAPKLVLCVIDAMAPEMLERAIAAGTAPVLERLMAGGLYVPDCVAAFPSVTPVCAASIVTGVGQDEHRIPAMNWYDRSEERYVEYGSSLRSAQRFGFGRQLDGHRLQHEPRAPVAEDPTVFESLDDAEVRTAGTTYLMYRGPLPARARARHDALACRGEADAPSGDGPARALLRGPVRVKENGLPIGARHAGRARPSLRLRLGIPRRERPVRLPAALAARQRLVLPQARAGGPAAVARAGRPAARARHERRRGRRASSSPSMRSSRWPTTRRRRLSARSRCRMSSPSSV